MVRVVFVVCIIVEYSIQESGDIIIVLTLGGFRAEFSCMCT